MSTNCSTWTIKSNTDGSLTLIGDANKFLSIGHTTVSLISDVKDSFITLDIYKNMNSDTWAIYGKKDQRFLVVEPQQTKCTINKTDGYNNCKLVLKGDSSRYPGKRAYWNITPIKGFFY